MKKNIFKSLFMSVLCILAVSCQDTDDFVNTLEIDSNKTQIMFSVGMDSPIARSRGTWGEDYNPSDGGDTYDNSINPSQLYVKITHGGQTYDVVKILKWQDKNNASSHTFVGEVDIDLKGQTKTMENAKIEVFANWNPDAENGDEFSQGADYIPMWGVQTATITLAPGKRETLSSIYLLRAMAKLQVNLNKDMFNEYALKSVTLNKHNTTGNCLPAGASAAANTRELGLETVLNAKKDATQSALQLPVAVEDSMYVVYLPEVENDGETDEDLLKITVQLAEKKNGELTGNTEEGSFFIKDYSNADDPKVIDIVRNHWYKYEIKGFAASEIQLNYTVVDWQNVGIEIGGDGFLFLNKDVIEIYNSNIDADQLKFSSSSPIKSIELKDLYAHDRDGNIVEGTTDGVSAYYLSKYGKKIQLGKDPGFDISDKQAALAREAVILSNIKAVAESDKLNGGITITSPFLADPANAISELKQNSHYDTPRYLEFEVTNEQDLTATFRVIQYPPVIITNEEGYFSYRDDFRIGDLDHIYDVNQFRGSYPSCMTMPIDNGEPTHYHNPTTPFFVIAGFFPYHLHEWDPVKKQMVRYPKQPTEAYGTCPSTRSTMGFEEGTFGLMERDYMRFDQYKDGFVSGVFHRTHYYWNDGTHFVGAAYNNTSSYYQNVGNVCEKQYEVDDIDPETGNVIGKKTITKYYRRHYTGDSFNFFYSKFVELPINSDGTGIIGSQRCQFDYTAPYTMWGVWYPNGNHRMYHIRTTITSDEYIIGKPNMITIDGRTYTGEGEANSRMVSPSFMVASMLGETQVPKDRNDGYIIPDEGGLYPLAQRQCEQYVETSFEDTNGNGTWEEGEPVTHYNDWRLPTKAEVALIQKYQDNSRAMDYLMPGETYYCASTVSGVYTAQTVLSDPVESAKNKGYYMRCVRDVKPNGQNGFIGK